MQLPARYLQALFGYLFTELVSCPMRLKYMVTDDNGGGHKSASYLTNRAEMCPWRVHGQVRTAGLTAVKRLWAGSTPLAASRAR